MPVSICRSSRPEEDICDDIPEFEACGGSILVSALKTGFIMKDIIAAINAQDRVMPAISFLCFRITTR